MANINIDPELGPDAAADMTDEELNYLCKIALWELAVRTDQEQFDSCLEEAMANRRQSSDEVAQVRKQRDMMQFAAQVMMDIQQLPEVGEPQDATTEDALHTGFYL